MSLNLGTLLQALPDDLGEFSKGKIIPRDDGSFMMPVWVKMSHDTQTAQKEAEEEPFASIVVYLDEDGEVLLFFLYLDTGLGQDKRWMLLIEINLANLSGDFVPRFALEDEDKDKKGGTLVINSNMTLPIPLSFVANRELLSRIVHHALEMFLAQSQDWVLSVANELNAPIH